MKRKIVIMEYVKIGMSTGHAAEPRIGGDSVTTPALDEFLNEGGM